MAKIRLQWPNQLMQSGANCRLAAACTSGCLLCCHSPKTFVLWPQSIDLELLHYTMGAICEALGVVGQLIQRDRTEGNVLWSHGKKKRKKRKTATDLQWLMGRRQGRGLLGTWCLAMAQWQDGWQILTSKTCRTKTNKKRHNDLELYFCLDLWYFFYISKSFICHLYIH